MNKKSNSSKPPKLAEWLLSNVTDKSIRYSALGDFEEQFQAIANERGVSRATIWYWLQITLSIPSFVMDAIYWSFVMLKSYLKLTFRNLVKNKMASIINLTGLSTAIGCSLVAFGFWDFHYNRDTFHENAKRIFLVQNVIASNKGEQVWGDTPLPLGPALEQDFPQIKRAVRWSYGRATVRHHDKVFQEQVQFVDKGFLQTFTFPLKFGDKAALSDRNAVVLTEEFAIKYFGETNPIGNELWITFSDGQKRASVVKGVTTEIPQNSSFRFSMLIPFAMRPDLEPQDHNDWSRMTRATFIELNDEQGIATVANQAQRYLDLQNAASPDRKMLELQFEPLLDMAENSYQTRKSIVWVNIVPGQLFSLFFGGLFLLLLACFNYMNISVVSATRRLKEIGIRKVVGGQRSHLVRQFLGENTLLCFIALAIGFALGEYFVVPGFRSLFPYLNIEIDLLGNTRLWLFMGALLLLTSLGSGAYPALYISSFQPVNIFRDKVKLSGKNRFTQVLLTFQFVLSFIQIVSGVALIQNNTYQRNRDWGYNQEQVLAVPLNNGSQFQELKNAVAQHPNVLMVAGALTNIGRTVRRTGIKIVDELYEVAEFDIGYDYLETMGLRLKAGRSFEREKPADLELGVIVNQSFVKMMQWQDPVGQHFKHHENELTIIGVVEDFHYRPFMAEVEPALLKLTEETEFQYLVAAVKPGTTVRTSEDLQHAWRTLFPDEPYNGYFQDTIFDGYMQAMTSVAQSSSFMAFVALLLTCMGIFGLVSITIAKRRKEISIRKVLGASVLSIANLINRRFVILFGVASLLALPAGYFLTKMMLGAIWHYHKALDPLPFAVAFVAVLVATFGTIASQVYKAVVANPVDALRDE